MAGLECFRSLSGLFQNYVTCFDFQTNRILQVGASQIYCLVLQCVVVSYSVLQCVALQCVALHCVALQCVAVCCSCCSSVSLECTAYVWCIKR